MSVWDYEGKRVVVAGCYSGMGEAVARELVAQGAEVHGFDVRESKVAMASFNAIDLRDKVSIDRAADTVKQPIDALFNCAGLPQTFPAKDVMRVNFIGLRHWTERLLPQIAKGGAIGLISSVAGMGWAEQLSGARELIATSDFEAAEAWVDAHADVVGDGYGFSKVVANVWTMMMGARFIHRGVRINAICPGPTETPMMPDFEKVVSKSLIDVFTRPIGRRATPVEQARPLLFLNSGAASYVNGHLLYVDGGFVSAVAVGEIDMDALLAQAR